MRKLLSRLGWTLFLLFATVASLLAFPGAIPDMVGAWCLLFVALSLTPLTFRDARRRGTLAWFPLVQLVLVLAVKQPPLGWGTMILSGALLFALWQVLVAWHAGAHDPPLRGLVRSRLRLLFAATAFAAGTCAVFAQWYFTEHTSRHPSLDPQRPIAVIGDSLSSGVEARHAYATHLRNMLSVPVKDFSRAGIQSDAALKTFPELLATRPQCVIIEIGGHDFLKHKPRSVPETNIRQMIDQARAADCEVILIEICRDMIHDPYHGMERRLADEYDLELISDTPLRRLIFWSTTVPPGTWMDARHHLSDDGLHPNDNGAKFLAETVAQALERVYGRTVLKQ